MVFSPVGLQSYSHLCVLLHKQLELKLLVPHRVEYLYKVIEHISWLSLWATGLTFICLGAKSRYGLLYTARDFGSRHIKSIRELTIIVVSVVILAEANQKVANQPSIYNYSFANRHVQVQEHQAAQKQQHKDHGSPSLTRKEWSLRPPVHPWGTPGHQLPRENLVKYFSEQALETIACIEHEEGVHGVQSNALDSQVEAQDSLLSIWTVPKVHVNLAESWSPEHAHWLTGAGLCLFGHEIRRNLPSYSQIPASLRQKQNFYSIVPLMWGRSAD